MSEPWSKDWIAQEWANVDYIREVVKNEGDAACGRAFDFLIALLSQREAAVIGASTALALAREALAKIERLTRTTAPSGDGFVPSGIVRVLLGAIREEAADALAHPAMGGGKESE